MAIYHLSAKIHSRSTGASAVARAAYRAREKLVDERTGERHDHSRRQDLDHAEILAPEEAPGWARDRSRLWNQVEAVERRKDAQVARELEVALPVELSPAQRLELVRDFVMDECVSRGMVADVALHGGDTHNPHAHVLLTTRRIGPDGFGGKDRSWNDRRLVGRWREEWASWSNRALETAGRTERVDHRTLEVQRDDAIARGDLGAARALDRDPEIHLGPSAWDALRRGEPNERVERSQALARGNAERERMREGMTEELIRLSSDIVRERRQERKQQRTGRPPNRSAWPPRDPDRGRGGGGWER